MTDQDDPPPAAIQPAAVQTGVPAKSPGVKALGAVKWLGITILIIIGSRLILAGQVDAGLAVIGAATTLLGTAVDLTAEQQRSLKMVARSIAVGVATANGIRQVKADVENIRDNPAQGGTPTEPDPP